MSKTKDSTESIQASNDEAEQELKITIAKLCHEHGHPLQNCTRTVYLIAVQKP